MKDWGQILDRLFMFFGDRVKINAELFYGMGGGLVLNTIWVQYKFKNIEHKIKDVIKGKMKKMKD